MSRRTPIHTTIAQSTFKKLKQMSDEEGEPMGVIIDKLVLGAYVNRSTIRKEILKTVIDEVLYKYMNVPDESAVDLVETMDMRVKQTK